jgi:hypothetical protein
MLGATLRALAGLRGGEPETSSHGRARIVSPASDDGAVSWGTGEPAAALGERLRELAAAVTGGA